MWHVVISDEEEEEEEEEEGEEELRFARRRYPEVASDCISNSA